MNRHRETGHSPIFYYRYTQPLPPEVNASSESALARAPVLGAAHDAQIAYALDNLNNVRRYAWTAADYDVSRIFSSYVEQFVKTGNPSGAQASADSASTEEAAGQNGKWLPRWPAVRADNRGMQMQTIGENTNSVWDRSGPRQGLIERLAAGDRSTAPTAAVATEAAVAPPSR
jgi:para-nitrobenzyl esterase